MSVVRRPVLSKDSHAIIEGDKSITLALDAPGEWQTLQSKILNHPDGSSNNYAYAPCRIPIFFESSQTFEFLGFQPAIAARMWETYNKVDASSSEDKKKYERDCYSIAGVRLPFVQSRMIPIIASGMFSSLFDDHVVSAPSNHPDNTENNNDNDNPSISSIETLLASEDKTGLLPCAIKAMYAIGTEFEGRLPTSPTLVQISNWVGELISRRFFHLEEIDYKVKKYHGKKAMDDEKNNDRLATKATTTSLLGFNRRDDDWGIKRYEALRVNRALERRIVITRWMIKELQENENYEEYEEEEEEEEDERWGGVSEGDVVCGKGRERGDWRECDSYVKG